MPMKSFIDSGAIIAIGTDFPACGDYPTMNPLDEIKTGVTRLPLPPDNNITKVLAGGGSIYKNNTLKIP